MLPDRVSNPGPLTYESGALPIALRGPAIQWITSCHKNRMTTRIITLRRVYVTSLTTSMSTMYFLIEIMFILKSIESHCKGSYD